MLPALLLAAMFVFGCKKPDTTAPEVTVILDQFNVIAGAEVTVSGNNLIVGGQKAASWRDAVTANCAVSLTFTPEKGSARAVQSGETITDAGILTITVTDEAGNTQTTSVKIDIINNAPEIALKTSEIDVSKGKVVSIEGNQLIIGDETVASWSDDRTQNCTISLKLDGKQIKSGDTLNTEGTLTLTITDEEGKDSSVNIQLNIINNAPEIDLKTSEINIFGGVPVSISNNQLILGDEVIASRSDDRTESCTISIQLDGKEIKAGDIIDQAGKLLLTVTDEGGKSSNVEINVTNDTIYGLETLNSLNIQVDNEVNLLNGISFADRVELVKIEIEMDGQRNQINDPHHYIPSYPGTCNIIFTVKGKSGETKEVKSSTLSINPLEYHTMPISNINPLGVFPQIGQIEAGDPDIYEYVKDLGVAETYVMRDMMGKYGSGDYAPEEIQELQSRVIIGLIGEKPDNYQDYPRIGSAFTPNITDHSNCTFKNLITLNGIHTNIMNLSNSDDGWAKNLSEYAKTHPNNIFIFSSSTTEVAYNQNDYKQDVFDKNIIDLCDLPNVIIFIAGGDTKTVNGVDLKIIYNGYYDEINGDGRYLRSSMANSDQNNYPNSNMRVVIGTDSKGNADMTTSSGSLFPVGFNNNVIISGRPILPIFRKGRRWGEDFPKNGSYNTSYVAPTDASETQLMFGLRPDVNDANKLLQMIESCTTDPDYISLNGQKQALQKYSPANFAKKYCLISDIPSTISTGEAFTMTKGRYKGVIFAIPGAEVKINGQWIAYNQEHESLIKSQNPMYLEWRLSGDALLKYGCTPGQTVRGRMLAVDDQWNGLGIEKEIAIRLE